MKTPVHIIAQSEYNFFSYSENIPHFFAGLIFTILLVYVGVYAVTTFISSCCGKLGSAILFSFVAMAVLPGIFTSYGNYFFSFVVGADQYKEIAANVGMLPPLGSIFSIAMYYSNADIIGAGQFDLSLLTDRPRCLIIYLLITAAFIIGAYFIGKHRKAEKVGEGFIYNGAHQALALMLVVMLIGIFSSKFSSEEGASGILFVVLISFVIYAALELLQKKNFKGFWKTILRFSVVFGVCFAFLMIVKNTNAFGIWKKLPSENNISEIRVSGKYFYTDFYDDSEHYYIYRAKDSVSRILSEHKKMLETSGLKTGSDLKITYIIKGGDEITREYSYIDRKNDEPIKNFSDVVKKLETFKSGSLGILESNDFSNIKAQFSRHQISNDNEKLPNGVIRNDKLEELAKLLKYDIENNYVYDEKDKSYLGYVFIEDQATEKSDLYDILPSYKYTLEFLNDTNNYGNVQEDPEKPKNFRIYYHNFEKSFDINLMVSSDDTSEAAKELLSYIEIKNGSNEDYVLDCNIKNTEDSFFDYGVRAENEKAAVKAMLKLFREKYAQ